MQKFLVLTAVLASLFHPAFAEDLPQGAKAPPPEPLPEPICDIAKPDGGDWMLGRWVAPYSKWEFSRAPGGAMTWSLDQKADLNASLGYKSGARLDGPVAAFSGCTMRLEAREGDGVAFAFEGVRTSDGKIYGYAVNPAGQQARWILRRER